MKTTKKTLKEEVNYRLFILSKAIDKINSKENEIISLMLVNEHSVLSEILELINTFEVRKGQEVFEKSLFTPIKCDRTKEPLMIGDKVENVKNECGYLHFDDYTNRYVIRTEEGGNIHSSYFRKVNELYEYIIDTTDVECRSKNRVLKQKW